MDNESSYPIFDVAIFDDASEAGPVLYIQVPFLPYPGLVIVIDDDAWEVRHVQVGPYQRAELERRLNEQKPPNLPVPVSVTAANKARAAKPGP